MNDTPQTNEWLIYDLSASLAPIGFKLNNPKLGFYDYKDEEGNEAILSLGVIGGETIYLSGPSVTLKNQKVFDYLDDLYKKGCRSYKGTYFSHRLPQFDEDKNVKWVFKIGEDAQNEATTINLAGYLKGQIIPLIVRWGSLKLTEEDVELLQTDTDAEYSLVANLFFGGKMKESEVLARKFLENLEDKDTYQKFVNELFGYQKKSLPMAFSN